MAEPLLEARRIVKSFGRVRALRGANFTVYPGEVVALVGDNGAGKSTLVKSWRASSRPTPARSCFEGRPVTIDSPLEARALGIETVYQDLALAADLDPAANLFLGREVPRGGLARQARLPRQAARCAAAPTRRSRASASACRTRPRRWRSMSGGQRQGVAVSRAVTWASKVVFMDEPTAALGVVQTRNVLDLIRRVRDQGLSVVLISHNMPEVFEVADRIEVLRLGERVARFKRGDVTMEDVVPADDRRAAVHEEDER